MLTPSQYYEGKWCHLGDKWKNLNPTVHRTGGTIHICLALVLHYKYLFHWMCILELPLKKMNRSRKQKQNVYRIHTMWKTCSESGSLHVPSELSDRMKSMFVCFIVNMFCYKLLVQESWKTALNGSAQRLGNCGVYDYHIQVQLSQYYMLHFFLSGEYNYYKPFE